MNDFESIDNLNERYVKASSAKIDSQITDLFTWSSSNSLATIFQILQLKIMKKIFFFFLYFRK